MQDKSYKQAELGPFSLSGNTVDIPSTAPPIYEQ